MGMKIAVVGASGFIGQEVIRLIHQNYPDAQLVGLSRSREGREKFENGREIEWRRCDLFSMLEIEEALEGVDLAFYLVHSMSPSAGLVQGRFDELDLLLADNFAHAASLRQLKHVIYLGGLIPEELQDTWSGHLKSRYEVEEILVSSGVPVSIFRAGLVVGKNGSSLEILRRLIVRLPLLLCPRWTKSKTSAIDNPTATKHLYDLGETKNLTYVEMMKDMAAFLGKKRLFLSVPFFSPKLSRLWVRVVTGAPRDLVYPLVMSLKHNLSPNFERLCSHVKMDKTFYQLLEKIDFSGRGVPHAFQRTHAKVRNVRSVQRIALQGKITGLEVAKTYMDWLPRFLFPFLNIRVQDEKVSFCLRGWQKPLLVLVRSDSRSSKNRQLFYINGGLLDRGGGKGRLEFRVLQNPQVLIVAIHDFRPMLPWRFYKYTQALVHLWVMKRFGSYINKKILHNLSG
mgnify:CR=1 FL=1